MKTLRIDEYLAQEIARDHTEHLVMKVYELLTTMAKTHRANSEKLTKYFNTFYQHYQVQEHYFQLSHLNPNFKTRSPKILMRIIGELFKKAQKNAMYVFSDRAAGTLVEHAPTKEQKQQSQGDRHGDRSTFVAVDSDAANKVIEGSTDINQIQKWLDLLEPVKFKGPDDQNLETQITILNIISMFCRDRDGKGVYPYQMQVIQHIFEKGENIPLRFGTAKVANVLRPFVYFVRPKATMKLQEFL